MGKGLLKDTTFELEKIRNEPLKDNKKLYKNTVLAMFKVVEIKKKRED